MNPLKQFFQKNEQALIAEIHNEFDTAQDRLLQQANEIIASNNTDAPMQLEDKAKRLESIGFVNTPIVKELIEIKKKREKIQRIVVHSQEQADLIQYYKREYPFQKFITESELDRICNKYKLIHAPVSNYIKDVPEKNLKEIELAKPLYSSHTPTDIIYCELTKDDTFCNSTSDGGHWCGIWGKEWYRIPKRIDGFHFTSKYRADDYLRENHGFTTTYLVKDIKNCTEQKTGLFIAAPKSHFDLTGLSKKGKYGYGIINIQIFESKDPIVYRYCKGGLQILSKWGLEASDEALLNPIDN